MTEERGGNNGIGVPGVAQRSSPTRYLTPHSCLRRNDEIGRRNDGNWPQEWRKGAQE